MSLFFLSVCDGLGCASLAFSPLGWRQVLSSEIEAAPRAVLEHRLGAHDMRRTGAGRLPLWGDMGALRVRHLRRFGIDLPDLLCGGTPCQGFSVAGLRGGMSDPRGALTLTFIRLANALDAARHHGGDQPIVVFWENVPGILSMEGNPFGHVLAGLVGENTPIEPVRGRWTDAGLAVGPRRAAAWRILDAQYFGLAQRRERLFVVASARDGFDPAAVLFEPEGVRRHSQPSRETGQSVAALTSSGVETCGADDNQGQAGHLIAEAFVDVHPTLRAGGNDTGGNRPPGTDVDTCEGLVLQTFAERGLSDYGQESLPCLRAKGGEAAGGSEAFVTYVTADVTHAMTAEGFDASEGGTGRGDPVIVFALRTNQTGANGSNVSADLAYPLCADEQPSAIAFALRGREDGAVPEVEGDGSAVGALRAASGGSSRDYVAFAENSRAELRLEGGDGQTASALKVGGGKPGQSYPAVASPTYGVRRLTPGECEALQGVARGYTLVPYRGKPMADGPRYKMLGNGWAVPVIRWIGERIAAEVELADLQTVERAA